MERLAANRRRTPAPNITRVRTYIPRTWTYPKKTGPESQRARKSKRQNKATFVHSFGTSLLFWKEIINVQDLTIAVEF
jgi:hypothetical protein